VHPRDIQVFAGVVLLLVTVSLLASLLPARRVARIDPVKTLAAE
jgi:ABC-type lipoprotein release transport system permease subunit